MYLPGEKNVTPNKSHIEKLVRNNEKKEPVRKSTRSSSSPITCVTEEVVRKISENEGEMEEESGKISITKTRSKYSLREKWETFGRNLFDVKR